MLTAQVTDLTGQRILLGYQTTNSGMTLGVGIDHVIEAGYAYQVEGSVSEDAGEVVVTGMAMPGTPIRITKFVTYQSSGGIAVPGLINQCRRTLDRTVRDGFGALADSQREHMDRFWDRADVEVHSRLNPVRIQQAVRWNLFQVVQASWRAEGSGIPAKGLTGTPTKGITSGTPRSTCCLFCRTPSRGAPAASCASGTACSTVPGSARGR